MSYLLRLLVLLLVLLPIAFLFLENDRRLVGANIQELPLSPAPGPLPNTVFRIPAALGLVPSLVIAGTAKAGTSTVIEKLSKTYLVQLREEGQPLKELNCLYEAEGSMEAVKECYARYFAPLQNITASSVKVLPVDKSPSYLDSRWTRELRLSPPEVLFRISPQSRVLCMLRQPTKRIRSLYNHWCHQKLRVCDDVPLEELVVEELRFLNQSAERVQEFVDARCVSRVDCDLWTPGWQLRKSYDEHHHLTTDAGTPRFPYVLTSVYFPFIHTWAKYFSGQLAVIQGEYFFQDPQRLWSLLGIEAEPSRNASEDVGSVGTNRAQNYSASSHFKPSTKKSLDDFFRKPNALLRSYLSLQSTKIVVAPLPADDNWWAEEDV